MYLTRPTRLGFEAFVLNYGLMPRSMIWNSNSEYPGVRVFAQKMKNAVLAFVKGDFVYLSAQNLSLPKGRARKLAPKFVGPFKILEDSFGFMFQTMIGGSPGVSPAKLRAWAKVEVG
jgi:hypothetical protein